MAEYLKQNRNKKQELNRLLSFGMTMEVAVYSLLCTESESAEAALAYIFELDENTGMM